MSTYLVTGAAGFIGSKVAEQLLAAGHTVVGVDNLNDYYDVRLKHYRLARLAELAGCEPEQVASLKEQVTGSDPQVSAFRSQVSLKSPRFTFQTLDIEDHAGLERVFAAHDFTAVFNLAARAGVRYSLEFPELYRRTNVLGEENVLKCQVKYGVRKHVLASSSSVYAGCPMPFTEDAVLGKMQSPYAETKYQAELLAKRYHEEHGLDVTVLRYFTVFGPAGRPDMAPFRFIKWIDEGTPITLYGDGSQARDFTYIDDIARGTILAGRLFGGQLRPEGGNLKPEGFGTESGRRLGGDGEAKLKAEGANANSDSQPQLPGKGSVPSTQVSGFKSQVSESRSQVSGLSGGLQPTFEVINLGGGNNPLSITAMIGIIQEALSTQRSAFSSQSSVKAVIKHLPPSPADMDRTWAVIAKADCLLGWKPNVSPADGFRKAVDWHLANRQWLQDIRL
jgi:UDP-glucuronate 4-epimerase